MNNFEDCPFYQVCETNEDRIDAIETAFPEKNFPIHHDYHDAKIKAARAEEAFWNDLKNDLKKRGIIGIITVLIGLMIYGAFIKLKALFGIAP